MMKAKFVITFFMVCFLFAASVVLTQNAQAAVNPADFATEGPITDADIQIYIDFLALQKSAATNPANLEEAIAKLASDKGVTETRIGYIGTKVPVAYQIAQTPSVVDQLKASLPPYLLPSEAEIDVVNKRLPDITKAITGQ